MVRTCPITREGMRVDIFIFTFNRPEMLANSIRELAEFGNVTVIDDGSTITPTHNPTYSFPNGGKKEFWHRYNFAFNLTKKSDADYFLFVPDDFSLYDLERIKRQVHSFRRNNKWVLNVMRDKRDECWVRGAPVYINEEIRCVKFCDCGFLTTKKVMRLLEHKILPVPPEWHERATSSGVGAQLSNRMKKLRIPIFQPLKSYVHHGEHDSVMHYLERKKYPLNSL